MSDSLLETENLDLKSSHQFSYDSESEKNLEEYVNKLVENQIEVALKEVNSINKRLNLKKGNFLVN